jgi:protein-S-isoprenylcysteine O-methyltransferase Ste14
VAGTLTILWVSRRSLVRPSSHGFPRFFAFEAVLGLILLNVEHWFEDPWSVRQLASWLFLCTALLFVIWGLALLRTRGGFEPGSQASPEFEWEKTERLVTTGIYRYVRHPMYSSLLLLTWGALLKAVTPGAALLAALSTVALAATATAEERENLGRFGQEYRDYMARTRRFVPFVV